MQKQESFDKQITKRKLYPTPTPIDNLEDIGIRCLNILKETTAITSEDTRSTQKLLNYFEIIAPQISLHEHNYKKQIPQLIMRLLNGETITQASDAGVPSTSDPDHELVTVCLEGELAMTALPGSTAGTATLIVPGLLPQPFTLYGPLPRKKKRQRDVLSALKEERPIQIFYESPHWIAETVATFTGVHGQERPAVICRELAKLHEEYLHGTLGELTEYLAENTPEDECCLLVSGFADEKETTTTMPATSLKEHVRVLMEEEGRGSKEVIKEVAELRDVEKQEVYREYHSI